MTHYYLADDIPLKTEFTIKGVAQIPLSGTVKIVDKNDVVIVAAGTAVSDITDTVATYNYVNAAIGEYAIFFTLDFGTPKITRGFYFRVVDLLYNKID